MEFLRYLWSLFLFLLSPLHNEHGTFHLGGFYESIDAAAVFANLAGLADEQLFVSGDDVRVPTENQIILVAAGVAQTSTQGCRLSSPALRRLNNLIILPFQGDADADVEPGSPHAVLDFRANPLIVDAGEALNAEVDSDTTLVAAQWCLLWFAAGPVAPLAGSYFTARATATATLTVDAWTNSQITFTQDLPVGDYRVVGMRAQAAGLVAARLLFRNQSMRPGCLGTDAPTDIEWPGFRYGGLGEWGTFNTNTPPSVDFLSVSADTAETVLLDLEKIS